MPQAEKVRELLPNMYFFAFYAYHSLEVFDGNTKINILIKLLLILLKSYEQLYMKMRNSTTQWFSYYIKYTK